MINARTVAGVHTHTHTSKFIEKIEGKKAFVCDRENNEQTKLVV